MKKSRFQVLLLFFISSSLFAKAPQPLCEGVAPEENVFAAGDGSESTPYLICNTKQFRRLGKEAELLNQHFKLGTNLNFGNSTFTPVGSPQDPFQGIFDGDDYVLNSVTLAPVIGGYLAPFPFIKNATLKNLTINGMKTALPGGEGVAGGMVGAADHSTLSNLVVKNLNMGAPDRSGGLVGQLLDSTLENSSTAGKMSQHFGTDASGGLVGYANRSTISACSSNVNLITTTPDPYGVSSIGGLAGIVANSVVTNVYALGDIDYSIALEATGPHIVGGLIGGMYFTQLNYAYYAGKIIINAEHLGGAVGATNPVTPIIPTGPSVFWDTELSGVLVSVVGEGYNTSTLKTKQFWQERGFDEAVWLLKAGKYPKLLPKA